MMYWEGGQKVGPGIYSIQRTLSKSLKGGKKKRRVKMPSRSYGGHLIGNRTEEARRVEHGLHKTWGQSKERGVRGRRLEFLKVETAMKGEEKRLTSGALKSAMGKGNKGEGLEEGGKSLVLYREV